MRKLLALLLITVMIPCMASADSEGFDLRGEWYVIESYSRRSASIDSDGIYHTPYGENEALFFPDGTCSFPGEEKIACSVLHLSDNADLFYDVQDHKLLGYLMLNTDDEMRCYEILDSSLVLFVEGMSIPYEKGDSMQYYIYGNHLYITKEVGYTRGLIENFGDTMLVYTIDEKLPFGGNPIMIFIDASII